MSLYDMLDAFCRDNLDELRTLLSTQKCSDTQDLRNTLLHEAVKENEKAITEFLLQVGTNPNSGNRLSITRPQIPPGNSGFRIRIMLLNHGADIKEGRRPLHNAARNGNLEIIEMLLNHGANINAKDAVGTSPLVYAIENKKDDATELLLKRGARLYSDNEGRTPLHVAAKWGLLKITKMLLQNGAPVNAVITSGFEKGHTPLHCAGCSYRKAIDIIEFLLSNKAEINVRAYGLYTPLYVAINHGNEDAAHMLINRGAKLDDEFSNGRTILSLALEKRLSSTVEEILTRCPDPQGEIAKCKELFRDLPEEMINILLKYCFDIEFFHIAIREGYIQIIESVLKDRLDLAANVDDSYLHIAVKTNQIESVNVLIAHGADVDAKDETGMTPLLYTAVDDINVIRGSPIKNEADVKVAKMLLAAGADVNAASTTEKLTPLQFASKRSKPQLVQVFLDHNADVNLRDKNGKTALHFAASKCSNSTKFLLENKANVNSKDFDGCTALHIAIDSNNCDVVELLLEFGADINIKNRNNDTPMDILNRGRRYYGEMYDLYCLTLNHALALEAINLYYAKDLRSSLSKLDSSDQIKMKSHFENCKQEIEKLKFVKVPGYKLTCYALMTRRIHSLASYVKNEDLITHFQSDDFTNKFPIYAPIIQSRLRNAFQRSPLISGAGDFFNYYFKLPHVCIDHILSCLSSDDLKNVKDAM